VLAGQAARFQHSPVGVNLLRWIEFTLAAIDGRGLDIDEMLVLTNTLFAYARGHAASEIGEREAGVRSGMSRAEWMAQHSASIYSIIESGRSPYFNRIVKDAAEGQLLAAFDATEAREGGSGMGEFSGDAPDACNLNEGSRGGWKAGRRSARP
jgi:hypothetical protein